MIPRLCVPPHRFEKRGTVNLPLIPVYVKELSVLGTSSDCRALLLLLGAWPSWPYSRAGVINPSSTLGTRAGDRVVLALLWPGVRLTETMHGQEKLLEDIKQHPDQIYRTPNDVAAGPPLQRWGAAGNSPRLCARASPMPGNDMDTAMRSWKPLCSNHAAE